MNNIKINFNDIKKIMKSHYKNNLIEDDNFIKKRDLTIGTFGKISIFKKNNVDYIVKNPRGNNKVDHDSAKADSIISSFLSSFQQLYLEKKLVPEIFSIYKVDTFSKKISNIIMERFEGDIFRIFTSIDITNNDQKKLLLKMIIDIANFLLILQENFQFMHNDLKTNNILYRRKDKTKPISYDNIYFVLTDFGGSSINIKSKVIKGSILGNDINFDKAKDLYLLIHVILTYQNQNYKEKLINFFHKIVNKIDLNYLIIDDNQWHKIYHLNQYPIDYEPSNILNSINKLLLE